MCQQEVSLRIDLIPGAPCIGVTSSVMTRLGGLHLPQGLTLTHYSDQAFSSGQQACLLVKSLAFPMVLLHCYAGQRFGILNYLQVRYRSFPVSQSAGG